MNAGQLRHQISIIQPPALAPGAYGVQPPASSSFVAFASGIWASIEPISAREFQYAHNFGATVTHKVRIRYLSGMLPTFQITYGTRTFSINGILNFEERNIYLDLYCTEIVA